MSAAIIHDLACPACGAPELVAAGARVTCSYCGRLYAGARAFCVNCQHVNPEDAAYCGRCGDPLTRACPACGETNWIGAEDCASCGRTLDILEYLARRHRYTTADTQRQAREFARDLKQQEELAAEHRSRGLWFAEHQRQEAAAQAAARRKARETQHLWMIAAAIILIVTGLAAAGLILATR